MSCPFEGDVLVLADGELSSERRYIVEAHLAVCPSCAAAEDSLDLVERTLRAAPPTPLGVVGPTLASLDARRGNGARIAVAASLLLAASVALALAWPAKDRVDLPTQPAVASTKSAVAPDVPLPRALSPEILVDLSPAEAAERVVKAGSAGRSMLRRALEDDDRKTRRRALAVANFAPGSTDVPAVAAMLEDKELGPVAARILGQIGSGEAVPALANALISPCAVEAREALVAIGGSSAIDALAQHAATDAETLDALTRTDAERAARLLVQSNQTTDELRPLLERRADRLVPELRHLLAMGEPRAARLLGCARDEPSIATLARMARNEPGAARALVEIGTEEAINAAFRAYYRTGRFAVAFDGATHAEAHLLGRLARGTVAECKAALSLLERCGGPATLEGIASRHWNVGAARGVIRTAGAIGGERSVRIIARWIDRPGLADEVAVALGRTKHDSAVPYLRELAERRQHVAAVAMALGKIGTRDSVLALIELLERDRAAARAHEQLVGIAGVDLGRDSKPWRRWWDSRS